MKKNLLLSLLGLTLMSALLPTSPAMALPVFGQMFVFGDSLSDIGNDCLLTGGAPQVGCNVPPSTRYASGHFSNDGIWVNTLAASMGISQSNFLPSLSNPNLSSQSASFAYGGSGTGVSNPTPGGFTVLGLTGQVSAFTTTVGGVADPNALYVVWSGPNDYLLGLSQNPATTVGNIATAIQNLYTLGARNFLVPNMSDLGETPIAAILGTQAALNFLTNVHNALLEQTLYGLLSTDPGITIYNPDIYALFQQIVADPGAFGFTQPVTAPGPASGCLFPLPGVQQDCSPLSSSLGPFNGPFAADGYVSWDEEHPTSRAHQLIAGVALNSQPIPEPVTAGLLLIGLVSLSVARWKQQAGYEA